MDSLMDFKSSRNNENSNPSVKICCISTIEEARSAIAHGASAIGLVSAMPSGPGVIDESMIAQIAAAVPPHIETFLLTSKQDTASIVEQHQRCRTTTIQLADHVDQAELEKLRKEKMIILKSLVWMQ